MKNLLKKITNIFKSHRIQISNAINPHKHWIIIIKTFFIIIIFLIIFSFFILYQIKNQEIFQITPSTNKSQVLLNENLLKNVKDSFNQKAQNITNLNSNPPKYQDPSL